VSDEVENLSDFPEVWQARGLEGAGQELGEGALTGEPVGGSSQLTCKYYSTSVKLVKGYLENFL